MDVMDTTPHVNENTMIYIFHSRIDCWIWKNLKLRNNDKFKKKINCF